MSGPAGGGWLLLHALAVMMAAGIALWLRPWRLLGAGGPPWPWLALWAAMPLLWGLDGLAKAPLLLPLSGSVLLVLLAGWPMAVLAMLPVAVLAAWMGGLPPAEALSRLAWLGLVPATLALGIGAAVRRWLPHHLFVFILARGFFGTLLACALAGWAAMAVQVLPVGSARGDMALALGLTAFAEAFITGAFTAVLVAFRPQWLWSYSDRLYLPAAAPG